MNKRNNNNQNKSKSTRNRKRNPTRNRRLVRNQRPQGPPVAIRRVNRFNSPRIRQTTFNRNFTKHREYLGSITTGGVANTYQVIKTFVGQPGNSITFPWFHNHARSYESYIINALKVEYVPHCSTGTPGKLMMLLDSDVLDNTPQSSLDLLNSAGACSTQVWSNLNMNINRERLNKGYKSRYIRGDSPIANADMKTYDFGNIFIAVQDAPANTGLGDIYITYDIQLLTPQRELSVVAGESQVFSTVKSSAGTASHPFKDASVSGEALARLDQSNNSYDTFKLNSPGYYLMDFLGRSMKASDGGVFNGGVRNIVDKLTYFDSKTSGQGFKVNSIFRSLDNGEFDFQGTGTSNGNQFLQNVLNLQKISEADFLNIKGGLLVQVDADLTTIFDHDVLEDLT